MKKLNKMILVGFVTVFFSNAVSAGPLNNTTIGGVMGDAYMSSMTGGPFVVSLGYDALGLAMIETGVVIGISLFANLLSSTTESDKNNLKMVKEVINKEAADYQMTGEIGLALGAAVNSLKTSYPEISDAEAIDSLVAAVN